MTANTLSSTEGELWDRYWKGSRLADWDYLSHCIYGAFRGASLPNGGLIIEAGSGSGRILAKLASGRGAKAVALDISQRALQASSLALEKAQVEFLAVRADITSIPLADMSSDLIWNAGVVEHFSREEQIAVLKEMARVVRPGRTVIVLSPNRRSLVYRLGKWILEATGRWPFGYEGPVGSLRHCENSNLRLAREYSISFLPIFINGVKYVPGLKSVEFHLQKLVVLLLRNRWVARVERASDRILSRLFGGYLLVSEFVREK